MPIGDFGDVLGSVTFAQWESQPPTLRKRTNNVALLLTLAVGTGHAYLRSLAINDAGQIDPTPIDTLQLDLATCRDMGLIHFLDDVFAVYANDHMANGLLWTAGCDEDGEITDAKIDFLVLGTASNTTRRSDLIKPHDGVLLPGASRPIGGLDLQTVAITDAGLMPDSVTESMALPIPPRIQTLRQGAGDRIIDLVSYAESYYIYSFTCTGAGVLPVGVTDSWDLIPGATDHNSLCKISDTVFAVFVKDNDNTLQIHTFSIQPNGNINKSWIDSEHVESVAGIHLHMMEMGAGYFVLAYVMAAPNWRLKTYFIAADGTIQDGQLDSKDLATGNRGNPWLEHLNGNIWTLTYEDAMESVRVDTIEIGMPGAARPHNELTMGTGP